MGTFELYEPVFNWLLAYRDSLRRGWELITVALHFFPPSVKFRGYLEGYLWKHVDPSPEYKKVSLSLSIYVSLYSYTCICNGAYEYCISIILFQEVHCACT